jgi:ankyrin repeat protein
VAIKLKLTALSCALVDHGADTLKRDTSGVNALHLALSLNLSNVVEHLCNTDNAAPLINMNDTTTNDTPFLLAISACNLKISEFMLMRGGNPNVVNIFGENAVHRVFHAITKIYDNEIPENGSADEDGWIKFLKK